MVPGKKDCLCKWDNCESSALLLSLILSGGYSCGDGMAATGAALLDALQRAHQPCEVVGSLTWSSAHHHSKKCTSCFNHSPVILLVHHSIKKCRSGFDSEFCNSCYWKYNSWVSACITVNTHAICLLTDIIGSVHGTPRTILRTMIGKLSYSFLLVLRAKVTRQMQDNMSFLVEMKQENTCCSQVLGLLVSSLHGNILASSTWASHKSAVIKSSRWKCQINQWFENYFITDFWWHQIWRSVLPKKTDGYDLWLHDGFDT